MSKKADTTKKADPVPKTDARPETASGKKGKEETAVKADPKKVLKKTTDEAQPASKTKKVDDKVAQEVDSRSKSKSKKDEERVAESATKNKSDKKDTKVEGSSKKGKETPQDAKGMKSPREEKKVGSESTKKGGAKEVSSKPTSKFPMKKAGLNSDFWTLGPSTSPQAKGKVIIVEPVQEDTKRKGKSPEPKGSEAEKMKSPKGKAGLKIELEDTKERPGSRKRGEESGRGKSQPREESPAGKNTKNSVQSPTSTKNSNLAEKLGLKKPNEKGADKNKATKKGPEVPDKKRAASKEPAKPDPKDKQRGKSKDKPEEKPKDTGKTKEKEKPAEASTKKGSSARPNTADKKTSNAKEELTIKEQSTNKSKGGKAQVEKSPERPQSPAKKGAKEEPETKTKKGEKPGSAKAGPTKELASPKGNTKELASPRGNKQIPVSASTKNLKSPKATDREMSTDRPKAKKSEPEFTAEEIRYLEMDLNHEMDFETRNKIWEVKKKAKIILGARENEETEVKDCTFQPRTNVKSHPEKVDPQEFYTKSVEWLKHKRSATLIKQEKIEQEIKQEFNKEKEKYKKTRVKSMHSMQQPQGPAVIIADHGFVNLISPGSNRPDYGSFAGYSKENSKEHFTDAELYGKRVNGSSPIEVDFGGIFASTQNTHKHRVIREEENEDAQLSARNGEEQRNSSGQLGTDRTKERPSHRQEAEEHDEDDERFQALKKYLNVSKKAGFAKLQTSDNLKSLQAKEIVVSEAKNPKELLKKNYAAIEIKNNRYVVVEQPVSPIAKDANEHSVDSEEKTEVCEMPKDQDQDEKKEFVGGESTM